MIEINVPFSSLGENSLVYAVIGVGGFLFTTMGSLMLRCLLKRRKDNKKLKKYQEEIKNVTEKVIQDTIKSHNLVATEEAQPVNRVNRKEQFDKMLREEDREDRVEDRVTIIRAEPV